MWGFLPVGAALVQKVQILNQQTEERNHNSRLQLAVIWFWLAAASPVPPHGRLQYCPIIAEIIARIHLTLQRLELGEGVQFGPLAWKERG